MTTSPKLSDAQVRAKLSQLKKIGLYNGNLRRKQPTKYGKSVLNKYMDVLEGKAHVVTVKPVSGSKAKGNRLAKQEFGATQRVVRNKVVIKGSGAETARFAPKTKDIRLTRTNAQGETYTRIVIKKTIRTKDDLPKLKKNQSFRIPFNRWGETAYIYRIDADELWALVQEYEGKYKGILRNVEVVTYKSARKARVARDEDGEDE